MVITSSWDWFWVFSTLVFVLLTLAASAGSFSVEDLLSLVLILLVYLRSTDPARADPVLPRQLRATLGTFTFTYSFF